MNEIETENYIKMQELIIGNSLYNMTVEEADKVINEWEKEKEILRKDYTPKEEKFTSEIDKAIELISDCGHNAFGLGNTEKESLFDFTKDTLQKVKDEKLVEVVRCKDCANRDEDDFCCEISDCVDEDYYCACGKKKEV
jgi:hypothetical protein